MHDDYIIRNASNEDGKSVQQVVFSVLREYGLRPDEHGKDSDLSNIELNYFSNNGYFGIVEFKPDGSIVGTFGLIRIDEYTCELRKMYLLKQARGKGVGKAMLEHAIQVAHEKKYRRIILETISPLKEAISLYRKRGFKEMPSADINDRVDQAFQLTI